jgi:DNA-binding NarL/FixJ family response regulator
MKPETMQSVRPLAIVTAREDATEAAQKAPASEPNGGQQLSLHCVPVDDHAGSAPKARAGSRPEAKQLLTDREQQVLTLLAAGDETPAVAKKLSVSESTVRTHVEKMRAKLGVRTRAALVAMGFRFGYLS